MAHMAYISLYCLHRHDSRYIIVDTNMAYILTYIAVEESEMETENVTDACLIQQNCCRQVLAVRASL